jgi:hypothetical protein
MGDTATSVGAASTVAPPSVESADDFDLPNERHVAQRGHGVPTSGPARHEPEAPGGTGWRLLRFAWPTSAGGRSGRYSPSAASGWR